MKNEEHNFYTKQNTDFCEKMSVNSKKKKQPKQLLHCYHALSWEIPINWNKLLYQERIYLNTTHTL